MNKPSTETARKADLDHGVAMRLAETEYQRVSALLASLTPQQWTQPTDCPGWDVRAMAGHMLGMAQMVATLPGLLRQQVASQRTAKRDGVAPIDALTALQVHMNANLGISEVVQQIRVLGPKAARGRRRTPAPVRSLRMHDAQHVGDQDEWWTFGFLFDVILTRDPFMHRIDITRATGTLMEATADHEGVIIDDIVREWAARHGQGFTLELSGPAGGRWGSGQGPLIRMDAFEFSRAVGGRGQATGLLTQQVPF